MTNTFYTKKLLVAQTKPIGNSGDQTCAAIQLLDTDRGILINSLTSLERNAIVSPVAGLLIYNTSNSLFEFYNGSIWTSVAGEAPDLQNNINTLRNLTCLTDNSNPTTSNQLIFNTTSQVGVTHIKISSSLTNPNVMNCTNALLNMGPTNSSTGGLLLIGSTTDLTKTCIFQVTEATFVTSYVNLTVQFVAQYGADFTSEEVLSVFLTPGSLDITGSLTTALEVSNNTLEVQAGYNIAINNHVVLDVYGRRISANTGTTIALDVGAGTGTPSIAIEGNDEAGLITLTVGTLPEYNQPVFHVTFENAYSVAPKAIILQPAEANAMIAFGAGNGPVVQPQNLTTTSWTATQIGATLQEGTQYKWWYHVLG